MLKDWSVLGEKDFFLPLPAASIIVNIRFEDGD